MSDVRKTVLLSDLEWNVVVTCMDLGVSADRVETYTTPGQDREACEIRAGKTYGIISSIRAQLAIQTAKQS